MILTVGELKKQLERYDDNTEISFCGLDFLKLAQRNEKLIQVEFSQSVYKDRYTGKVVIDN
jgi:hypothetical protein